MKRLPLERIYCDENVRIRAIIGTSRRLIVVFAGAPVDFGAFSLNVFARLDTDHGRDHVIFVSERNRNWYSAAGTVAKIRNIISSFAEAYAIEARTSFGASAGGYGAILVSDDNFETVVAVNPQISMHPAVIGNRNDHPDMRHLPDACPILGPDLPTSLAEKIRDSRSRYYVVYGDSDYRDWFQRRLLSPLPNLTVFVIRGADHALWKAIHLLGVAPDFLGACFDHKTPEVAHICGLVARAYSSGEYDRKRGRNLAGRIAARLRRHARRVRIRCWEVKMNLTR